MAPTLVPLLALLGALGSDPEAVAGRDPALAPAEDDTGDDSMVGPPDVVPGCFERLDALGVKYTKANLKVRRKGAIQCGAPQAVRYDKGPGGIRWRGRPMVSCPMALSMARFELVVQQEAKAELGRTVAKIHHLGTYNCREMAAYPGWVSEHSYANGIDIKTFVLTGGREVPILGRYGDGSGPVDDPAGRFLWGVARRSYDEDVFSVVLTPAFDKRHRNHFHVDRARYRVDGTRIEQ